MQEIERKWFVKNLPDLSDLKSVGYERYFLHIGSDVEIRIQKKGEKYEFERKVETGELSRTGQKFEIIVAEFDSLKKLSSKSIIRESYLLQKSPEISLKIYHGEHEGLMRVEVEFESESEEAKILSPLNGLEKR